MSKINNSDNTKMLARTQITRITHALLMGY
jgi:hypothetical protein